MQQKVRGWSGWPILLRALNPLYEFMRSHSRALRSRKSPNMVSTIVGAVDLANSSTTIDRIQRMLLSIFE